jgi:imidazolonepropionase-like amidohydrolase
VIRRRCHFACLALFLVAALVVGEPTHAQRPINKDFVVSRVRVFDGTRTVQDTNVVVSNGIIRAIGDALDTWRQLPVLDGTGLTLVPGLIDAHTHVRAAEELRQALRFGVTTMLDMGATEALRSEELFALRAAARVTPDMSDLLAAGYIATASGGILPTPSVSTADEAKQFVSRRRAEGSDYLKILLTGVRAATTGVPNLDESRVRALVDAAHSNGMLAVAHVETLDDVQLALSAGVDGFAQVCGEAAPTRRLLAGLPRIAFL